MQVALTTENERQLQSLVDAGAFTDVETALNEIVTRQLSWAEWVRARLAEADADLAAGHYTDYDEEGLRAFFDELMSEPHTKP
jgi:Arc/MetJ-type ribon-helix-helix transcriptional regulator